MAIERLHPEKLVDDRFANLRKLYPEAFSEGRIDWDTLRVLLADQLDEDYQAAEPFGLSWPGKRQAMRLFATSPKKAALIPLPGQGIDEERTRNVFIEGDNLDVLKVLKKAYQGKIKMIYIDPPYNTGNDFVYNDDFKVRLKDLKASQVDGEGALTTNTKAQGRFHSTWLSMMYPRLRLAKELLSDDGVIFISIDDCELNYLIDICCEIFGGENHVATFIWKSKSGGANDSGAVAVDHEYVVCFAKNSESNPIGLDPDAVATTSYNHQDENGRYSLERLDKQNLGYQRSLDFPIAGPDGKSYTVRQKDPANPNARWRWSADTVRDHYDELVFVGDFVYTKNYEKSEHKPRSLLVEDRFGRTRTGGTELREMIPEGVFDNPKPTKLIDFLVNIGSKPDSIILDFFSGSGTTAHSVLKLNAASGGSRRFILVQISDDKCDVKSPAFKAGFDTIAEIGKERIRRVINKLSDDLGRTSGDLDLGFKVFKLDESSFKPWETYRGESVAEIEELFKSAVTPLRSDWRSNMNGLLTEVLLILGFPLDSAVEASGEYRNNSVLTVSSDFHPDRHLFVCLDEHLDQDTVESLDLGEHDLFVCLDSAIDDQSKARLADKGKIYTI